MRQGVSEPVLGGSSSGAAEAPWWHACTCCFTGMWQHRGCCTAWDRAWRGLAQEWERREGGPPSSPQPPAHVGPLWLSPWCQGLPTGASAWQCSRETTSSSSASWSATPSTLPA